MSTTIYYVFITLLLGLLILFLGAGFAFGCRLRELDRGGGKDSES